MDWDELDPKTKAPKPKNLEVMSVEELEGYIAALDAEIQRARQAIHAKRDVRAGAEALFRK